MSSYQLSFGKIILLEDNLAEVIIDDGVEIDIKMVDEYHNFLLEHLSAPFTLLINKLNQYSYTFEAQKNIATIPEVKAMAVVAYDQQSEVAQLSLNEVPRKVTWNLKIFPQRDIALNWLYQQAL